MAVSAVIKEPAKAKAAAEAEAATPPPKKRAFNWKLPVIALCVIGAAGGGAYWWMHRPHDAAREVKAESVKPPQFMPLETFTVNLKLEDNPQFLQVGLTLKVSDALVIEALKLHMPEVRDSVLLLLSSQKASVLLTLEGKRKLATDIVTSINAILAPAQPEPAPNAAAPAPAEGEAKKAAEGDAKPVAEGEATPAAEAAAKPAEEADATPAAESGDAANPAAPPAPPVLSVLFTSFIIQ
jgi:flagellar FliL protein